MSEHFPRPWRIDPHALSIYSSETPKGCARVADLRGWGYLTGKGHGALGLSNDDGIAAQRANAELIIKAVNLHETLLAELILARARIEYLGAACTGSRHYDHNADVVLPRIDAVIASAVGGAPDA